MVPPGSRLARTASLAACLAAAWLWVGSARAEDPIAYRRVLAPLDRPEVWPKPEESWTPIPQSELKERLRQLATESQARPPSIARLDLYARLEEGLLKGEGRAKVQLRNSRKGFLAWPSKSTRLTNARWEQPSSPAMLGQWGQAEGSAHGLLVDREGWLRFGFRTAGTSRGTEHRLEAPIAVMTSLVLDLPKKLTPSVVGGIARRVRADETTSPAPAEPPAKHTRWLLRPPPHESWRVRISGAAPAPRTKSKPRLRQVTEHLVQEQGVDTRSILTLTPSPGLPQTLAFSIPSDASVVGILHDNQPVDWTLRKNTAGRIGVHVTLPKPSGAGDSQVSVRLFSPLKLGAPNTLPTVLSPEVDWREGRLGVKIEEPLRLLLFEQTGEAAITSQDAQSIGLQATSPDDAVRLTVAMPGMPKATRVERRVHLSPGQAAAEIKVHLAASLFTAGKEFDLPLQPGWVVASVDTQPAVAMEESRVVKLANTNALRLRYAAQPVADELNQVTLQVALTKQFQAGLTSSIEDLTALDLAAVAPNSDSLVLVAADSYELHFRDAPLVTAQQAADDPSAAVRLDLEGPVSASEYASTRVLVARTAENQAASSRVVVTHEAAMWNYRALVTLSGVQPAQAGPAIRFRPALPKNAVVTINGAPAPSVENLRDDQRPGEQADAGAIVLPANAVGGQPVVFEFSAPAGKALRVPLPALEGPLRQTGVLELVGVDNGTAGLKSSGLTPLPDSGGSGRRSYHYDPARVMSRRAMATLHTQSPPINNQAAALVSIQTHLLPHGEVVHNATYRHVSEGVALSLRLPTGAQLLAVRDPSDQALEYEIDGNPSRLTILPKPHANTFKVIYQHSAAAQEDGRHVTVSVPEGSTTDVWKWVVVAPSGVSVASDSTNLGWQPRLFGPLALASSQKPLNPFSPESWRESFAWASHWVWPTDGSSAGRAGPHGNDWAIHQATLAGATQSSVTLVDYRRRDRMLSVGAVLTIIAAAFCWPRAVPHCAVLTLVCGVSALVLPTWAAPWATACWLGMIGGAALCVPVNRYLASAKRKEEQRRSATVTAVAAVVLLLSATPAESQPNATPHDQVATVLVPVDDSGEPSGDKWYVDGPLLRRIETTSQRVAPTNWVLRSCLLTGAMRQEGASTGFQPGRWSLELDAWTTRRNTTISLPINEQEANWATKALVDGIAVPLRWDEQGERCELRIAEPGACRILISFEPRTVVTDAESCIHLALPRCPNKTLRLTRPAALTDLRLPGATERVARPSAAAQVTADLGGLADLLVCWTDSEPIESKDKTPCDILQWVDIQPDGVTLECRFLVDASSLTDTLLINVPEGLVAEGEPGSPGTLRLTPEGETADSKDRTLFSARFRLNRISGLGRVVLPVVTPQDTTLRSRQLAVTSHPAVDASLGSNQAAPITAAAFLADWSGDVESPPGLAFTGAASTDNWQLQVNAQGHSPKVLDQRLRLVFGQTNIACHFRASLTSGSWPTPWIEASIPTGFHPQRARLTSGDTTYDVALLRPSATRLILSLPSNSIGEGEVTLALTGYMRTQGSQATPLPLVALQPAVHLPVRVELARRHDTLVQFLDATPDLITAPSSADHSRETGEVSFASLRVAPAQSTPRVRVAPNPVSFHIGTVSHHEPSTDGVMQRCEAKLTVTSGVLTQLTLDSQYPGRQLAVITPQNVKLDARPDEGQGRYRLALPMPLNEGQSIVMQFGLEESTTSEAMPGVLLTFPDATQQHHQVALARLEGNQQGKWANSDLTPTRAMPGSLSEPFELPDWLLFMAQIPKRAAVTWIPSNQAPPNCTVEFQTSQAAVDSQRGIATRTRMLLNPAGAAACRIRVPNDRRLVSLDINGQRVVATRISSTDWNVLLLSTQERQLLTVATVSHAADLHKASIALTSALSPDGAPLVPSEAVVSLRDGEQVGLEPVAPSLPLGRTALEGLMLRRLAAASPTSDTQDGYDWWRSRLSDALGAVNNSAFPWEGDADPELRATSVPAAIAYAARLNDTPLEYVEDVSAQPLGSLFDQQEGWRHFQAPVYSEQQVLNRVSRVRHDISKRAALVLLLLGGIAAVRYSRTERLPGILKRHGRVAIAVIGLVWWLWLPAGVLGLLVMAIAVLMALRERRGRVAFGA